MATELNLKAGALAIIKMHNTTLSINTEIV